MAPVESQYDKITDLSSEILENSEERIKTVDLAVCTSNSALRPFENDKAEL